MSSATIVRLPERVATAVGGVDAPASGPALPFDEITVVRSSVAADGTRAARELEVETSPRTGRLAVHGIATFVTYFSVCVLLLTVGPVLFGFTTVTVSSASMTPTLQVTDAVITEPPNGPVPVGAVIDFENADGTTMHRVVERDGRGYRTKGDANDNADTSVVAPAAIRGRGVVVVPFAGAPSYLANRQRWPELIALAVMMAAFTRASSRSWLMNGRRRTARPRRGTPAC